MQTKHHVTAVALLLVFSGEKRSSTWCAPKIASVIKFVHEDAKYNHLLTSYNRD